MSDQLPTKVVITDIKIPFGSMVNLILMVVLATIPVAIVLFILGAVFTLFLGAIGAR